MANQVPYSKNLTTGQNAVLTSADILTDLSGNVVVPPVSKIVSTTSSISLLATGTTNLYTVPSGKTFVPVMAVIRPTTATSISADAVAGIGVAAGEDDIFAATTLTNMRSTGSSFYLSTPSGLSARVSAGSIIKLGVDTAATGTALTVSVDLLGYFQDETTGQGGGFTDSFIGCGLVSTAPSISVSSNTWTAFTWTGAEEAYDTNNFHSGVTNTGRITIPSGYGGYYSVIASVTFSSSQTTGSRGFRVLLFNSSGASLSPLYGRNAENPTATNFQGIRQNLLNCFNVYLSAGDYITVEGYSDVATSFAEGYMWVYLIGQ